MHKFFGVNPTQWNYTLTHTPRISDHTILEQWDSTGVDGKRVFNISFVIINVMCFGDVGGVIGKC